MLPPLLRMAAGCRRTATLRGTTGGIYGSARNADCPLMNRSVGPHSLPRAGEASPTYGQNSARSSDGLPSALRSCAPLACA